VHAFRVVNGSDDCADAGANNREWQAQQQNLFLCAETDAEAAAPAIITREETDRSSSAGSDEETDQSAMASSVALAGKPAGKVDWNLNGTRQRRFFGRRDRGRGRAGRLG